MATVIEFPTAEPSQEPGETYDFQLLDRQLSLALLDCARCHIDTCEVPDQDEFVRAVARIARHAFAYAETGDA